MLTQAVPDNVADDLHNLSNIAPQLPVKVSYGVCRSLPGGMQ
jgi:hypothetical protein